MLACATHGKADRDADDIALVALIAGGDDVALGSLYGRHRHLIFALACRARPPFRKELSGVKVLHLAGHQVPRYASY